MTIKYGVVTWWSLSRRNVDSLSHFLLDFHGILHFYCKVRSPQKNGSQVYSTHFLLCWGPTWQLREKQVKVWWNFSNKIELECSTAAYDISWSSLGSFLPRHYGIERCENSRLRDWRSTHAISNAENSSYLWSDWQLFRVERTRFERGEYHYHMYYVEL